MYAEQKNTLNKVTKIKNVTGVIMLYIVFYY